MTYSCLWFFRSVIQAKLLQSPEISGVHPNKPAHPEDEGDVPQKNRYHMTALALSQT